MRDETRNYAVGYKRPPVEYQWKPGQSGNPRGRGRRRKLPEPVDLIDGLVDALLADQRVQMNGRNKIVPLYVALAESLVRDGLRGSFRERLLLFQHLSRFGVDDRLHSRIVQQREEDEEQARDEWLAEVNMIIGNIKRESPHLFESDDREQSRCPTR